MAVHGGPSLFDTLIRDDIGFTAIKPYLNIPEIKYAHSFVKAREIMNKLMLTGSVNRFFTLAKGTDGKPPPSDTALDLATAVSGLVWLETDETDEPSAGATSYVKPKK